MDEAPTTGSYGVLDVLRTCAEIIPEAVWAKVAERLYPAQSDNNTAYLRSYRLRLALEKWFAATIPPSVMLDWAARNLLNGPVYVAELAEVSGTPMDELPRGLLVRFGEDERVKDSLYGQFVSGSWWGEYSSWLKQKLDIARMWSGEPERAVSSWAFKLVADLQEQIRQAELQEAEQIF